MSLFDLIRTNVIEGRKVAEDEGYTEGLVGQPAVSELVSRAVEREEPEIKEMIDSLSSGMEEMGGIIRDLEEAQDCARR